MHVMTEVLFSNSVNDCFFKGNRRSKVSNLQHFGNIQLFEVDLQLFSFDNREPDMASSIMGLYIHPTVQGHLSYRAGYLTGEVDLWNCVVWQQTLGPIC